MAGSGGGAPSSKSLSCGTPPAEAEVLRAELAAARAQIAEERARHAAELRAAEDRLRLILDGASGYAIITLDLQRHVTSWNAGAEAILGWRAEEMLGASGDILFTPEERAGGVPEREAAAALSLGAVRCARWQYRADGTRFWADGALMALREGGASGAAGLLRILRDMTEDRLRQDALRESEEQLRHTVELNPQIPWSADLNGRIIRFSQRWLDLTGLTYEQGAGDGWKAVAHPNDLPRLWSAWKRCLSTGTSLDVEGRFRLSDGSFRWYRTRAAPRRDAGGAIVSWHGTSEDIHDRKLAEARLEALVELGDRLREARDPTAISNAAAEMIGRALDASRAGYAAFDTDGHILVGRDWTDNKVQSLAGTWRVDDFWHGREGGLWELTTVSDVDRDPRTPMVAAAYRAISVRAMIEVPVVLDDRVAGIIFIHDAAPRCWSEDEVAFARGAAERAWGAIQRAAAETRQALMASELNHRVKNTLAVVQAIALQTVRGSLDLGSFAPAFQARLIALSRAHDLLTEREWQGAPLHEVASAAVAIGDDVRVDLTGCVADRMLAPAQALSLSMALHELGTNAVKHGALSVPGGSVSVTCRPAEDGGEQVLEWTEKGGPAVDGSPARKGFGLRLLERGLAANAGVTARLDFAPGGVHCILRLHSIVLPVAALGVGGSGLG